MNTGEEVIQHPNTDHERTGRILELRGSSAVVLFYDRGTRLVPQDTLTLLADLRNELDNDNVGT